MRNFTVKSALAMCLCLLSLSVFAGNGQIKPDYESTKLIIGNWETTITEPGYGTFKMKQTYYSNHTMLWSVHGQYGEYAYLKATWRIQGDLLIVQYYEQSDPEINLVDGMEYASRISWINNNTLRISSLYDSRDYLEFKRK